VPLAETQELGEQFDQIVSELAAETPKNPETHAIYANLGQAALIEPKTIGQGKAITPELPYFTNRNLIRQSAARFIGGLSVAQRRHTR
jgi:hypothetical protein